MTLSPRQRAAAHRAITRRSVDQWLIGAATVLGAGPAEADDLPWFEQGRPGAQTQAALKVLNAAATHGLEPERYAFAALQQAAIEAAGAHRWMKRPCCPARQRRSLQLTALKA